MKTLNDLVRPNIWNLKPYSSARDEYHGDAHVFLDANENPYNAPYNRYPDPLQKALKEKIGELKDVPTDRIFVGNGSDEAIDLVIRIFCEPAVDNIVAINPTYGMYEVAANINNVAYRKVNLDANYTLNADKLLAATDDKTKLIFLCSPNNPTGNSLSKEEIDKVIAGFEGIVVLDEAYADFSTRISYIAELDKQPNLIVLQTMSKAWGAAGIRLGMAFASTEIIRLYNKVKYPYNVNQLTQEHALDILDCQGQMREQLVMILGERTKLQHTLLQMPCVAELYPTDANFILVKVNDPTAIYAYLVEKGIIIRNRNQVQLCEGCLRITIGTEEENAALITALKEYKS